MSQDSQDSLFQDTSAQIEKLNELIASKDEDLKRSQKHTEKIEKDKQGLKVEIQSSLIALQHTKSELHEIKAENIKLIKTLRVSLDETFEWVLMELFPRKMTFLSRSSRSNWTL